jgi:membrane-associated phospholipid phosphatase
MSEKKATEARLPQGRAFLILQVIYVGGLSAYLAYRGIFPGPELMLLLLATVFYGRLRKSGFWRDFLPFILLLCSYQALRGFADNVSPMDINITNLIDWERALFGGIIPAAYLQELLADKPYTRFLDAVATLLYVSHFVTPLMVAVVIWQRKKQAYWPFVIGLVALSFAGFATYMFFPAAPPWWAHEYGYLPEPVDPARFIFPSLTVLASPNAVAAMPSLHCAFPAYFALFCVWLWRSPRAYLLFLLPLGIGFSTIYLGHHYVVDIVAGYLYGIVFFLLAVWWAGGLWQRQRLEVEKA